MSGKRLVARTKFSDGTSYDAAAIKFNWARLQDPANAASTATYANLMQSMDPVDATTYGSGGRCLRSIDYRTAGLQEDAV